MEGWLTIHENDIPVHDVTMHLDTGGIGSGSLGDKTGCHGGAGLLVHVFEGIQGSVR